MEEYDEIKPLHNLNELLHWRSNLLPVSSVARIQLPPGTRLRTGRPRTLLCHDMKGGYQEDSFIQGVNTKDCYRFFHWPHIDIFVYFSHHFITIPPPVWTNAAHRHNVLMLGQCHFLGLLQHTSIIHSTYVSLHIKTFK
jgi:mannosyl-glycoprotein endo-beta-N-acetylglucosaminidase